MWFAILGPMVARDGDDLLQVTSPRQRALLAALLLRHGHAVSIASLTEEIWEGSPPATATDTLRSHVMRLRRALGHGGRRLQARYPGYLLEVGEREFDVIQFTTGLRRAREAERDARWQICASELARALALWRGTPLSDVPGSSRLAEAVLPLNELHLQAIQTRINAELHLGHHHDVISELMALTRSHRSREAFTAQLMLALYRDGRQAEALSAYAQAREYLVREIGVDPGPELQQVHRRILANDLAADLSQLPSDGGMAAGQPGAVTLSPAQDPVPADPAGETHAGSWRAGSAGPGHDCPAGKVVHGLPADLGDFTARDQQVAELIRHLTPSDWAPAPAIAHILGMPGIGKTSLAVHVAYSVADQYPDGQLFIRMAGSAPERNEADLILGNLLQSLGVPASDLPGATSERAAAVRTMLSTRRVLLIADDAGCPEHIRPLLLIGGGSALIVTSRTLSSAVVGGLPVHLAPLTDAESAQMLAAIVGPSRLADEADEAGILADQCEGLPLALRIAAVRSAAAPVAVMRRKLAGHRLNQLFAGDMAVRGTIASSYHALDDPVKAGFRALSVLSADEFTARRASAVIGADAEHIVDILVDRCLLAAVGLDDHGLPRYRMHALISEYASEQALEAAQAEPASTSR